MFKIKFNNFHYFPPAGHILSVYCIVYISILHKKKKYDQQNMLELDNSLLPQATPFMKHKHANTFFHKKNYNFAKM